MNERSPAPAPDAGRNLIRLGLLLLMLGLLTGFVIPQMANPRMGLSSHLEGVLNGMLLVVLGLLWPRVELSSMARSLAFGLAVYGTYANWLATLLAGFWGAGETMMPLAAAGHTGEAFQEGLIAFALISLSVSILVVTAMLLWGLRTRPADPD